MTSWLLADCVRGFAGFPKWFVNPIPPKNMSLNLPLGTTLRQLFATPNDKPLETYQQ